MFHPFNRYQFPVFQETDKRIRNAYPQIPSAWASAFPCVSYCSVIIQYLLAIWNDAPTIHPIPEQ